MDNLVSEVRPNDIAIVGVAGRFPKAKDVKQFWSNLSGGVEAITFFEDEELDELVSMAEKKHPAYIKAGFVMEDIDKFDAAFFNYTPKEAQIMDPQHRIFLELAWSAIEDAGYNPEKYEGKIGVFAGASSNMYMRNVYSQPELVHPLNGYSGMIVHGNSSDYLTNRVSYKLNLTGPSLTVQTSCSTSLVAVHVACQNLINFDCDMALAGGISIQVPQKQGYFYLEESILSPDGHCRAFDAKAKGTVFGSGGGIVVLKRLEDALLDGDAIYAVIKGSAVNNDGSFKVGYTAPSIKGQAEVIAEAIALAEVEPESISYVEAHGTGTALGDPIEIEALSQVYQAQTDKKGFCALGSVKTNVGHLGAASGVTGLIKTVLALKHRKLPASLHYEEPNPKIDFLNSPFYVNHSLAEWETNGQHPRRAGVSSFGIGGTNAHVILEEAPPQIDTQNQSALHHLLRISAKSQDALEEATRNLTEYLQTNPDVSLADAAYTLHIGRKAFQYRRILVCAKQPANEKSITWLNNLEKATETGSELTSPSIVFLFSGEEDKDANWGLELYREQPVFREKLNECAELFQKYSGLDLLSALHLLKEHKAGPKLEVGEELGLPSRALAPAWLQAITFSLEYARASLWLALGVKPEAMIGQGVGEYAAACLAEVLTLEEAFGMLTEQLKRGQDQEILSQPTYLKPVERLSFNSPQIPYISAASGTWITKEELEKPEYWATPSKVNPRFASCVAELLDRQETIILELGAGQTRSESITLHRASTVLALPTTSASVKQSDLEVFLTTVGKLWLNGIDVDHEVLYADQRHRVSLPTYPFARNRHWLEMVRRQAAESRNEQHQDASNGSAAQTIDQSFGLDGSQQKDSSSLENTLSAIWLEVLGLDTIDVNDDFFEAGGNSLIITQILTRIREEYSIEITIQDFFSAPTIHKQARMVEELLVEKLAELSDEEAEKLFS